MFASRLYRRARNRSSPIRSNSAAEPLGGGPARGASRRFAINSLRSHDFL